MFLKWPLMLVYEKAKLYCLVGISRSWIIYSMMHLDIQYWIIRNGFIYEKPKMSSGCDLPLFVDDRGSYYPSYIGDSNNPRTGNPYQPGFNGMIEGF